MGCSYSIERGTKNEKFSSTLNNKKGSRKLVIQPIESPRQRSSKKTTEKKVKSVPAGSHSSHIDLTVSTTIQSALDSPTKTLRNDSSNGCISPPLPSDGCLPYYSSYGYLKHAYNDSPSVIFSPLKGRKKHSDK
jgi:hypothetical protein